MGLKNETGYTVKSLNITTPTAYARISGISIDLLGNVKAIAEIQQTREAIGNLGTLERCEVNFVYDKTGNPYELAYIELKSVLGEDWEDDNPEIIIEEESEMQEGE